MTDLSRMILAARQIGEVVGEDLLARLRFDDQGLVEIVGLTESVEPCYVLMLNADALDLLTARVWRAVQKHCHALAWDLVWRGNGRVELMNKKYQIFPDLPSAVAAIHAHWKEQNNG